MGRMTCLIAVALAVTTTGCGDDSTPPTDAGPLPDAPLRPDAGVPPDTGPGPDAGGTGDGNDSFAEALPVVVDDTAGVDGVIDPPGDMDYFTFDGTEGAWIAINTDANPDDDPMMVDTVITLFDSSMTQIAQNDDAQPRVNTDSEIIIRLPATGTYYIQVQEWSTWDMSATTPEGDPTFTYNLTVMEIEPAAAVVTMDPESGDDAASAAALAFAMNVSFVLGTFNDDTDVDVYSLTVAADTGNFQSTIMPWGTDGYGSTTSAGAMWVTDETGSTLIARVDNSVAGFDELSPALAPGSYLLWLQHPGGGSGSNDFYVLKNRRIADNAAEADEAGNGTLAGAEALAQMDVMGAQVGFILAALGDGDVDYFSFDVAAGEQVSVACGSASAGSGVRDLLVEVRDGSDMTLSMQTEAAPDNVFIQDAMVTGPGVFFLRLSKGSQDPEVTGNWVRCGVRAFVPAAAGV